MHTFYNINKLINSSPKTSQKSIHDLHDRNSHKNKRVKALLKRTKN